jgi:hypothetical protein
MDTLIGKIEHLTDKDTRTLQEKTNEIKVVRYCKCHELYNPDCNCKAELRRDKDKVCFDCFKGYHSNIKL